MTASQDTGRAGGVLFRGGFGRASAVLPGTLLLTLLLAQSLGPARAEAPTGLVLAYRVYAGGFHALSFRTEVSLGSESYAARLAARSDGLLDALLRFSLEAEVAGRALAGGLAPTRFRSANRWRESGERLVEISYAPDGLPEARVEPPAEQDERDPVPDGLRRGTLDPISAVLSLVRGLAEHGRCEAKARVFDGRRRFDLLASDLGEAELAPSPAAPFAGKATRCRIGFRPVSGFWKDDRRADAGTREIEVYLARVVPGGPPVPVRLEAQNDFGALRIHLVSADALGAGPGGPP
ncbi:MAG: DUF3108 domain-containing protein [Rhodospirillales bacterium]|nr:DUF3108 domain-containing protein [Rhodospirillales bacterium]